MHIQTVKAAYRRYARVYVESRPEEEPIEGEQAESLKPTRELLA